MAITYHTKKYKILQKVSDNEANIMHPETESIITLVDNGPGKYPGQATNVQDALKELNDKIESATENAIISRTTAQWNAEPELISRLNTVYVYTDAFHYDIDDHGTIKNIEVAGIKVGDGNTLLIEKPFVTDYVANLIAQHIEDNVRHITAKERIKWNNKLNYEDEIVDETLVLTRN